MKRYIKALSLALVLIMALTIPSMAFAAPVIVQASFNVTISGGSYSFDTLSTRNRTTKTTTGQLHLTNYSGSLPTSFTGDIKLYALDEDYDTIGYKKHSFDYPYVNTFNESSSYVYTGAETYKYARVRYDFLGFEIRVDLF